MRMHGTLHYGSLTGGCALFDKEYRFERRHFQEQRLNEKPIREYLKDTSGTASTAANLRRARVNSRQLDSAGICVYGM